MGVRHVPLVAALLLCCAAGEGKAIELKGAEKVRKLINKNNLKETAVVGYLPSAEHVEAYNQVVSNLATDRFGMGLEFYYVSDRHTLEVLGLVSGEHIAVYRPWAPKKQFKSSYRRTIVGVTTNKVAFRDWLLREALAPLAFAPAPLALVYDRASERQRKPILRFYLNSDVADETDVKPANWVEEATMKDPKASKPDTWDDEEDGEWEAEVIANPEYKGPWRQRRLSTLREDEDHVMPEHWDLRETIPDGAKPDTWDEDEDGEWEPEMVPNPGYQGPWAARKLPQKDQIERALKALAPAQKKFGDKLIFTVEDASGDVHADRLRGKTRAMQFRWSDADYAAGRSIVIETKKYSTLKYDHKDFGMSDHLVEPGKRFMFTGETGFDSDAVLEFVQAWADRKLVDEKKKERLAEEAKMKKESHSSEL
eukprot:TRINITY_DN36046_c0_g1_i1.p2 TRINITY_DN36046_c0_g1~~TRINITY_DN36046_c0_g1_i1.p2  ORF type:complete len:424 (+),score=193.84 TRINITY_DN36046_c0_g1_i1:56-1327(+)